MIYGSGLHYALLRSVSALAVIISFHGGWSPRCSTAARPSTLGGWLSVRCFRFFYLLWQNYHLSTLPPASLQKNNWSPCHSSRQAVVQLLGSLESGWLLRSLWRLRRHCAEKTCVSNKCNKVIHTHSMVLHFYGSHTSIRSYRMSMTKINLVLLYWNCS